MPIHNLHIPIGLFSFCVLTLVQVQAQGFCELCPVDHYCLNTVVNACPAGTTSLVGSNSLGDCTGTPEPTTTTTTPTTQTTDSTVTFIATLQMTLIEFNTTVREAYTTGVALAFSTQVSNVAIGTVTEFVTRRRLLSTYIEVETIVTVGSNEADSLANATTTESLSTELGPMGILVSDVSTPVVEEVVEPTTATPPPSPPPDGLTGPDNTPPPEPVYVPPVSPPEAPDPGEWIDISC